MRKSFQDPPIIARGRGHHVVRRILPLFAPYRWQLVIAGVFVAFSSFTIAMMPLFTRYVIDQAIPRRDLHLVALVMSGFMGLMVLRMASWYAGQSYLLLIREKVIFLLRSKVFARLQMLCLRFHQRYSPGYLYDRALGGASVSIGTFLSMLFNTLVVSCFSLLVSVVICLQMNSRLALLMLVMSSGYVFIARYFHRRIHDLTMEFNRETNKFAGVVLDMLRGIKTIKAFAMEQRIINDFDERLWPLQLRSLELNKETMRLGFFSEGLGYCISALIIVFGAAMVLRENLTLGSLVAFIAYQSSVIGMISSLSTIAGTYGAAVAGLEQMYEVLDERSTVLDKPGAVMPAECDGAVEFEHVDFTYDDRPVFHDVSFHVPAGQSVALVGPSGSGKTTLVNLLLRFYDPEQGVVRVDGYDIRELPVPAYRGRFGVVLQDPFLFNDSIYHNLLSVKPDADEVQLRDALERAQAWEFISTLKNGWHFKVGENGSHLSGGQRQRIAIARCFLTNPRLMVLDEATSALDNYSERLVQQALQAIMQGRTVFVIAHRLSTVRHVDRILVLRDGRIAQDGTYAELSETPGLFHDLLQASLDPLATEVDGAN